VLHLCGNVRQWIISGVGGRPDIRKRDEEFARKDGVTTSELREELENTIGQAVRVIQNVQHDRLVEKISVQDRNPSVLEAIYVVVEHFGEHAGQIMYMTNKMTREDLGYYRHLNAQKSNR
jgi:Protein of unknown function (DUF1572)